MLIEAKAPALHAFVEMVEQAQKSCSAFIYPLNDDGLPGVEPEQYVGCEDSNRIKWNRMKGCWQVTYKNEAGSSVNSSAPFQVNVMAAKSTDALEKLTKAKLNAARVVWNKADKTSASRYLLKKSV